ncbi:MAG: MerR family transcriptional regulator [Clostridia bacterium]|nr:MerR family transcriptional regulator [Clostridia bacterium]MBQ8926172.1 MerR family transcriptional regulator [Clostridia bacterium]
MKPMTVKQVSELTGVSVRTLQYYDDIGLLSPSERTEAGYRLYEEEQLATLQEILLFRELEFPLKDIKAILDSPAHDKEKALQQQVELLTMKKERLERLIRLAEELQAERHTERSHTMDFKAFDKSKLDEYAKRAREQYSDTDAYKEYEIKSAGRTSEDEQAFAQEFMAIFAKFGALQSGNTAPGSEEAQALVKELQDYITEHFYHCTPEILSGLGKMYAADGEFKENIDAAGGPGTAEFVSQAIDIYSTTRSA